MGCAYHYYKVDFRYVDKNNRIKTDSITLDAKNKADAKNRVIRGEKPKMIAIDRVVRV